MSDQSRGPNLTGVTVCPRHRGVTSQLPKMTGVGLKVLMLLDRSNEGTKNVRPGQLTEIAMGILE